MSIYAIGDVHGCFLTLKALFKTAEIKPEDMVVFVGDLVDRGPRIKEVLDFVFERPNTHILLGNHDFCFVDWFNPGGHARNEFMLTQGLSQTLWQLGEDAREYAVKLGSKPFVINESSGKYVFCHADYNWAKGESFSASSYGGHIWNRIDANSHNDYNGPVIIHGHTPVPLEKAIEQKIDGSVFAINLDGGAVYPQFPFSCLRALRLDDGKFFEQKSLDFKV